MKLLIDTSALLALMLRNDQNHGPAIAFLRARPDARFVLTDLILSEVVTRLRARSDAERAVAIAHDLLASRRYDVLFVDIVTVRGALEVMKQFRDKRLSLPDCVSFEIMKRLGIGTAFTFDRDFRDCGFAMLP